MVTHFPSSLFYSSNLGNCVHGGPGPRALHAMALKCLPHLSWLMQDRQVLAFLLGRACAVPLCRFLQK